MADTNIPPTQSSTRPLVFDAKAKALADARASRRQAQRGVSFLLQRVAEDAADRLQDINRRMERAVLVGRFDVRQLMVDILPATRQPAQFDYVCDVSQLDGSYDLVLSLLELQGDEVFPDTLVQLRHALNPDGLCLVATLGGQTLTELRQSLYAVDQAILGGASPRVWPMVDYSQSAALLGRAGLALPVVDADKFTVSYRALETLVADLRDMGLTNILDQRVRTQLPRQFKSELNKTYRENFTRDDGKFLATFEILWLTGWAPHKSQQKPLKPGSAKMRLADALGTKEEKL